MPGPQDPVSIAHAIFLHVPAGVTDIRATLQRRAAAAAARALVRAGALSAKLPGANEILTRHGAKVTWVFGSLARRDASDTSDVDLAVEGLPPAAYFTVLAELMLHFGVRVDLVRLEEAGASLRACVLEEGRRL